MVGHEDIPAHKPGIRGFPSLAKGVVNGFIGENLFFVSGANGEKENGRAVEDFSQILTGGVMSSEGIHWGEFSHAQERQKIKNGGRIMPRWRAGIMGADEASPSNGFDGHSRAAFVIKLEGRPPCRPILAGRSPAPVPKDNAALARGKNGRRRSIALQGFREALTRRVRGETGGATSVSSDSCGAQPRPQFRWQETSAHRLSAQFEQAAEGVFDEAVRATGAGCDADGQVFAVR